MVNLKYTASIDIVSEKLQSDFVFDVRFYNSPERTDPARRIKALINQPPFGSWRNMQADFLPLQSCGDVIEQERRDAAHI